MMNIKNACRTALVACALTACCMTSFAADPVPAPAPAPGLTSSPDANPWRLSLDLYTWAPSLTGTIGVAGHETNIDVSPIDLVKNSDSLVALSGRIEVGKGPYEAYVDGLYMKIGKNDVALGAANIDARLSFGVVTFGGYYRLGVWPLCGGGATKVDTGGPTLALDVGPAGRLMYVKAQLNFKDGRDFEQSETWVDALAATQLTLDIDKHWEITFRGDVGAGMSDYTWQTTLLAAYRFKIFTKYDASLNLGYQAIGDKYNHNGFTYDAVLYGPVFFFGVKF